MNVLKKKINSFKFKVKNVDYVKLNVNNAKTTLSTVFNALVLTEFHPNVNVIKATFKVALAYHQIVLKLI